MQGSGQIGGLLTMTRAKTPYLPTCCRPPWPGAVVKTGHTYLLHRVSRADPLFG